MRVTALLPIPCPTLRIPCQRRNVSLCRPDEFPAPQAQRICRNPLTWRRQSCGDRAFDARSGKISLPDSLQQGIALAATHQVVALPIGERPGANPTSAAASSSAYSSDASTTSESAYRYALPYLTWPAGSLCPPGIWHMLAFRVSAQRCGNARRHWLQSVRRSRSRRPMEARLLQPTEAVKSAFPLFPPHAVLRISSALHCRPESKPHHTPPFGY